MALKHRYIEAAQVAQQVMSEDALNATKQALQFEIIASTLKGKALAEFKEQQGDPAEKRAVAADKVKGARLTAAEVAAAKREFLDQWIPAMENEHVKQATLAEINDGTDEGDAHLRSAKELETTLRKAYAALDRLPKPPKVAGDGGTANRQVRRARKTAAKKSPAAKVTPIRKKA